MQSAHCKVQNEGKHPKDHGAAYAAARVMGLRPWRLVAAEFNRRHPRGEPLSQADACLIGLKAIGKLRRTIEESPDNHFRFIVRRPAVIWPKQPRRAKGGAGRLHLGDAVRVRDDARSRFAGRTALVCREPMQAKYVMVRFPDRTAEYQLRTEWLEVIPS